MTDQTIDPDALANAAPNADESADAADLWAEFDEAEGTATPSPDDAAADDGFTVETDEAGVEMEGTVVDGEAEIAAPNAAPAVAPSMWDSAPADLRAEFERVTAENARLAQKERSASGRATGFQRRYEDLLKAAQPREVAGDRPTPDAALATIKQDYPEIAGPLEQAFGAIEGRVATLAEAEEGRRKAAETDLDDFLQQEGDALLAQHPDYLDVLKGNTDRFSAWIDDQPRAFRDAFARNSQQITNAAEAATVISAFKAHLNPPAAAPATTGGRTTPLSAQRQRQLGSTASLSGASRRPTVSGIPEEGDPQDIWDAFEAAEQR